MSLDQSDHFYRYLFDAAPDVMMLVDRHGIVQVANSRFEEVLGLTPTDGLAFQSLLPDANRSEFEVLLTGVAEGTSMPEVEVLVLTPSGKRIPMMLDVRQPSGEVPHFLLRLRDLREIRALEQEYRHLFESIADAVFIGDPESGQIYRVNRQACALTGYSHGEMVACDYDHLHALPWADVCKETASANGELSGRETALLTKAGDPVPVEISVRIVCRGDDHIYIESAMDISVRKALEKRMQDLRNEWDGFVRHELRSPLTPILAFSQILMEDFPDIQQNEKVMQYLESIWQGGKRLENLLDLTREVTQYEHGEISLQWLDVDVIQTVREAVQEASLGVNSEPGRGDRVRLILPEGIDETEGIVFFHDIQKIQRAVGNLVKNALEHDPGEVTVRVADLGEAVEVAVHNWGAPIPEDRLATIFEKFNTTKRHAKGTGLGTTIAKLFVEAHGGGIRVATSAEEGTTFTIALPKRRTVASAADGAA